MILKSVPWRTDSEAEVYVQVDGDHCVDACKELTKASLAKDGLDCVVTAAM